MQWKTLYTLQPGFCFNFTIEGKNQQKIHTLLIAPSNINSWKQCFDLTDLRQALWNLTLGLTIPGEDLLDRNITQLKLLGAIIGVSIFGLLSPFSFIFWSYKFFGGCVHPIGIVNGTTAFKVFIILALLLEFHCLWCIWMESGNKVFRTVLVCLE